MSDINTDSEFDYGTGSRKSTKLSGDVEPFPPIDFDDAGCSSSNNKDSEIEMIKTKSTSKVQTNLMHQPRNGTE